MIKDMRIDFLRVLHRGAPLFRLGDILGAIAGQPLPNRNHEIGGDTFRLQSLNRNGPLVDGDMVRIRMDNIPVKASLDGSIEDLALDDDEGIGEESAFVFDTELAVLVYQRNRTGVSSWRFGSYIDNFANLDEAVAIDPIIQSDAYRKIIEMDRQTRIELRCARVDNPEFWPGADAVSETMRRFSNLKAGNVALTVSCGRGDAAMDRGVVRNIVDSLRGMARADHDHDRALKALRVTGKTANDETLVVDLLEDRMVETCEVDVGSHRHAPYEGRVAKLMDAYRARRAEIRGMFDVHARQA